MEKLGIRLNLGTAYHPQSDGQTERVNQCIEAYLRCMLFNHPKNWSRWLPLAEYWYNSNFHSSLGTTPFQALYGYAPPMLPMGSLPRCSVEEVNVLMKERHQWLLELRTQLHKAQDRMKRYADEKRSERTFKEGDWVYVKLQPYRQVSVQGRNNLKLSPKYHGPFEVLAKVGTIAYQLRLPEGSQVHSVFHVSQLKKRVGKGEVEPPSEPLVHPQHELVEYPEGILGRRFIKRNNSSVNQILIKWKGRDTEDASWEDYERIKHKFPAFILEDKEEFERRAMSGNRAIQLGAVEQVDQVKNLNEKGAAGLVKEGSNGAETMRLTNGAQINNNDGAREGDVDEEAMATGTQSVPLSG